MKLNFHRLFNLNMTHAYSGNGVPGGMYLSPIGVTVKKLSSGRMLMKPLKRGITVLYETRPDGFTPRSEIGQPFDLMFGIYLNAPGLFFNVTDLTLPGGDSYSRGNLLWYSAETDGSAGEHELSGAIVDSLKKERFRFSHTLEGDDADRVLRIEDESGNPVSAGTDAEGQPLPDNLLLTPDSSGLVSTDITLSGRGGRLFVLTLHRTTDDELLHREDFFADSALHAFPPLGIVRLRFTGYPKPADGSSEMPLPVSFRLTFGARQTHWRYYVINRSGKVIHNGASMDSLAVLPSDSSDLPEGTQFPRLSPPGGGNFSIDGYDTAAFRSSVELPFREAAFTGLMLLNDGDELLSHMPNPSPVSTVKRFGDSSETETYIYL
jgi:hypothetical protein